MESQSLRITIIEKASSWSSRLSSALVDQGYDVTCTHAPDSVEGAGLVLIGFESGTVSREQVAQIREKAPTAKIIVIVPPNDDPNPTSLLEATNVDGIMQRGDGLWRAISVVETVAFANQRFVRRFIVRIPVRAQSDKFKGKGSLRDIAIGGAMLLVPFRLQNVLETGDKMKLSFTNPADRSKLHVNSIIRRSFVRRTFWGKRLALGAQFLDVDDELRRRLDEMMRFLTDTEGMQDEVDLLGSSDML